MRRKIPILLSVLLVVPLISRASSQSESLKDDVFAMVATTQMVNTFFVIDTSEQTNAFAYSGYIDSCADAKSKLSKSLAMCWQAYADCQETNANLMCGASLDCTSTRNKCLTLEANNIKLNTFCALVESPDRYKEPDLLETEEGCFPSTAPNSKACRFLGPWNPKHDDYTYDLCFYDWAADTGANIPDTSDYSYSQYPNPYNPPRTDAPDRRDWRCLSDNGVPVTRSGLWLNWRFTTSLDAMKIILTDDHRFAYAPHRRGEVTEVCRERRWTPAGGGDQCWEYVNYNSLSAAQKSLFRTMVRQTWISSETGNTVCDSDPNPQQCCQNYFQVIEPASGPVCSVAHQSCIGPSAGCGQCFDRYGADVACDKELYSSRKNQPSDPAPVVLTASNLRSNCRVFHCSRPKCRDDKTCVSDPASCPGGLGAYSEWDQDPEHCCDPVGDPASCDPATQFCCVEEGSSSSGSFMPGPGATTYTEQEASFPMDPLGTDEFYSLVELDMGTTTTVPCNTDTDCTTPRTCDPISGKCTGTSFPCSSDEECVFSLCDTSSSPGVCVAGSVWRVTILPDAARLKNARAEFFYGCSNGSAKDKFYEGVYTSGAVETLPYAIPLTGCDTSGYKIKVRLWVTHKNDADGFASARIEAQMRLSYTRVTPSVLRVFDPTKPHFIGGSWEPVLSEPSTPVKEFECESVFYRMRSKVVSGSGGSCDTVQCDVPGGCLPYPQCLSAGNCALPYPGCTRKEIIAIGQDQWGNTTKSLCTWLCPDAPQYDDVWKCLAYFESNDTAPYPNGGTGPQGDTVQYNTFLQKNIERVACKQSVACTQNSDCPEGHTCDTTLKQCRGFPSLFECCATLNAFASEYEVLKTFDTNLYKDIQGTSGGRSGTFKCGMAHFQEGIANNQRRKTAGVTVQITRGHINELPGGGTYLLSPFTNPFKNRDTNEFGPTPYVGSDKWYSQYALPNYGSSAISSSNVFVFRTGENGNREPACIYNIVQDLYGEDCDTCGMGCCMMDLGDINYCDFPVFWIRVAKTDGGNLVLPLTHLGEEASPLVGAALDRFRNRVINLKGVGGATIAETLYDVWRYLGGLQPAYTDNSARGGSISRYTSPIQAQPRCFINNAVVISSGQPNFDSNTTMDGQNFNGDSSPCPTYPPPLPPASPYPPCVKEVSSWTDDEGHTYQEPLSTVSPPEDRPYYAVNWYISALPQVAAFIHRTDAFHSDPACREANPNNYRFGFVGPGPCDPAQDTSGPNVINRVDTVGIGAWALAPLYSLAGNETGYLDADKTMIATAQAGEGTFYSLTVGSTVSNDLEKSFVNLAQVFNALSEEYPGTFALGRPHWTSSPVQPSGRYQEAMNNIAFLPGTVPITQRISRFWFGNLKKYYLWRRTTPGSSCILGENNTLIPGAECEWKSFDNNDLLDDCFNPTPDAVTGTGPGVVEFNKVLSGGVAANLAAQLRPCGARPCYRGSTGRIIYTDDGNNLVNFASLEPSQLGFGVSDDDAVTIIDYVYGYDSVDHNGNTIRTEKRTELLPITMSDPFADPTERPIPQITVPYSILGAAVHSKPLAVYYDSVSDENLRIFYAANDGLVHCFDGVEEAGHPNEKWAYMPSVVKPEMQFILSGLDAVTFSSTIDGPLTLFHIDTNADGIINNNEKAYLIIAYRRGIGVNSGYTVINISNKNSPAYVQHLSIEGQSWSKPAIFRLGGTYYIAFGGGYDPCLDDSVPSCPTPTRGAQIHVYPWDGSRFSESSGTTFTVANNPWLVASIAAEAVAVNTQAPLFTKSGGTLTGNTEMLYFVDVTGTIFRLSYGSSGWVLKTVMTMRDSPTPFNFSDGIKSYYSFMPSPIYEQFLRVQVDGNGDGDLADAEDVNLVPVPLLTGNIVYPNESRIQYELVVLYDRLPNGNLSLPPNPPPNEPARYPIGFLDMFDQNTVNTYFNGAQQYTNLYRGYYIALPGTTANGTPNLEEKGMASPLTYYNWDIDTYALFATTYRPVISTDPTEAACSNKGSSFLYCRNLPTGDGNLVDERYEKCSTCPLIALGEGLAQTPQVLKGDRQPNDEIVGVSVGANVRVASEELPPPPKTIKILKWYEIY